MIVPHVVATEVVTVLRLAPLLVNQVDNTMCNSRRCSSMGVDSGMIRLLVMVLDSLFLIRLFFQSSSVGSAEKVNGVGSAAFK